MVTTPDPAWTGASRRRSGVQSNPEREDGEREREREREGKGQGRDRGRRTAEQG